MNLSAVPSLRQLRSASKCFEHVSLAQVKAAGIALLFGAATLGQAQDFHPSAIQVTPKLRTHILKPASELSREQAMRERAELRRVRVAPQATGTPVNTGSGIVYTCASNVAAATCSYLNTTVAGYYNSTFTNANANIYVTYGQTGLGESQGYYNLVSYSSYHTALTNNTNKSSVQTTALSSMNTYDATPYSGGNVEVTAALGAALGFSGMTGTTPTLQACTPGTSGCYNEIVTVISDPQDFGFSLYYDNLGGTEPTNAYDFYAVVEHETDEVLGTSSCISTGNSTLNDGCDFAGGNGVPSAVDLWRWSSPGTLALDTTPSTSPGQYFSYDGGVHYGAYGRDGSPKVYNTLANGDDFADYVSSSPDCGTGEAIQDAEGCPGEDSGMTILNDGKSEITLLNTVGYDVPAAANTQAAMSSPTPSSTLTSPNVTFTWTTGTGASGYALWIGTSPGTSNVYVTGVFSGTSRTVTGLPVNGETLYVRLFTSFSGTLAHTDYQYTAAKGGVMTSPAPTTMLAGPNVTFSWSAGTGASGYAIWIGTSPGASNVYATGVFTGTSRMVVGLPTTGATLYVRLFTSFSGTLGHTDYTYTEPTSATMTSPSPGTTLSGSTVTFTWTSGVGETGYAMWIGTSQGTSNVYGTGVFNSTSRTVTGLPTNGEGLWVRLFTSFNGTLAHTDYQYTAQ